MLAIYPQTAKPDIHVLYVLYASAWDRPCRAYMRGRKNVSNATKEDADSQDHLGGLGWGQFFLVNPKVIETPKWKLMWFIMPSLFCLGRTQLIAMTHMSLPPWPSLTTPCICHLFWSWWWSYWMDFFAPAQDQKIQVWIATHLVFVGWRSRTKNINDQDPQNHIYDTISRPTTDLVRQSMTIKT